MAEPAEEKTLREAMAASGPMAAKRAVPLVAAIAKILAESHAKEIVHGELGAGHIVLGDDDEPPAITKLPLAKVEGADAKRDVRALGIILYEMLTGVVPGDEPEAPSKIAKSVPKSVDAVVLRCLSNDPYADAGALAAALDAVDLADAQTKRVKEEREQARKDWAEKQKEEGRPNIPQPTVDHGPKTLGQRISAVAPAIVLVVVVAGILLYMKRAEDAAGTADSPIGSGAAPGRHEPPKGLAALPAPKCNDAANTEVKAGREALRQLGHPAAEARFEAAVKADGSCGEAYLRLAMLRQTTNPTAAREAMAKARALVDKLSARDKEVLTALEPAFAAEPNVAETRKRMRKLAAITHNDDAEVLVLAAAELPDDPLYAQSVARRATRIDPGYADGWLVFGTASERAGELISAEDAYSKCIGNAPNASDCIIEQILLMRRLGRCDDAERAAMTALDKHPDLHAVRPLLSSIRATKGATREIVEQTLAPWEASLSPPRDFEKPLRRAMTAVLYGDFATARSELDALGRMVASRNDFEARAAWVVAMLELLDEAGDTEAAKQLAEEQAKSIATWSRPPRFSRTAWGARWVEPMLALRVPSARDALLGPWRRRGERGDGGANVHGEPLSGDLDPTATWAFGDAIFASDAKAAQESIVRLPHQTHPVGAAFPTVDFIAGKTELLARRPPLAEPFLKLAFARCDASEYPFAHVRAHEQYGETLEWLGGRTEEACKEYAAVMKRWGGALPEPVTVKRTKERMAVLKCPK